MSLRHAGGRVENAGSCRAYGYTWTSDAHHPFIYANGVFTAIAALDNDLNIGNGWNPAGDIVGVSGSRGFLFHGGVRTVFAVPGADNTGATGISSNGDIVGYSLNVGAGGATTNSRGFLLRGSVFTSIAVPGALETTANGINGGAVVGTMVAADLERHAFVYRNAVLTRIDVPGSPSTFGQGINATGQVVGTSDTGAFRIPKGFIATPTTNTCTAP